MSRIDDLKTLNKIPFGSAVTVDDLFLRDENGKTYLDYIIENDIDIDDENLLQYISNNYGLLEYVTKKGYILNNYYNIPLLFVGNPPLIIYLYQNDNFIIYLRIINEIFCNNELVIQLMQLNFNKFCYLISKVYDAESLYKCFSEINRLDLLEYANEYTLLSKISTGNLLIEEILKRGIELHNFKGKIRDEKIIQILFYYKRYNEILNINLTVLLNKPDKENNYIKMLIQKYHEGEKIDFNLISDSSNYNRKTPVIYKALCYMQCLKSNVPIDRKILSDYFVILNIVKVDPEFGYKLIEQYNLENDIITDFKEKNPLKTDLDSYNLPKIFNSSANPKEFMLKLDNNEITKITSHDILFKDLLIPYKDSTILDYLLKHNIDISIFDFYFEINTDIDIIVTLINNKYEYEKTNASSFLFEDITEDKKIIDLLLLNGYDEVISDDMRIIPYAIKYHDFSIISYNIFGELLFERNGNFKIEEYLNNEEFLEFFNSLIIRDPKTLVKLYEKGYKKALIRASEDVLLTKYNGITILEDLLKSGIVPKLSWNSINSQEVMDLLIKYQRYDLLGKATLPLLMNKPSKENNYLSFVIKCIENGIETDFEKIDDKTYSKITDKELLARCYIQMGRSNLLNYLPSLDVYSLLDRGDDNHNLLYYLLQIDEDLTLNKLLTLSLKRNVYVSYYLSEYGILEVNAAPFAANYASGLSNMYVKRQNEMYLNGTEATDESLIDELYELFASDGQSDMNIIQALATSYRYNLRVNPSITDEIIKLIEIKKEHPEFCYVAIPGKMDGYFDCKKNQVAVSEPIIATINHETAHALHYYCTDYIVPDNLDEVIARVTSSEEWQKKVVEFSDKYRETTQKVAIRCQNIVDGNPGTQTAAEEIMETYTQNEEDLKNEYLALGYSREVIDIVFSQTFTLDEVIKAIKIMQLSELNVTIMYSEYPDLIAISDIIDSLSNGIFAGSISENQNDDKIMFGIAGHGIRYYSNIYRKFMEIIADYSEIIKSKYAEEGIEYLRYIVGDEFVDLIENFYNEQILGKEKINKQSL